MSRLKWYAMAVCAMPLVTACHVSGWPGAGVDVARCWSDETTQTVQQIVDSNLKDGVSRALQILGANGNDVDGLRIALKLSYQHPVKADQAIGAVECSASADATLTTKQNPQGVVLHAEDLGYTVYPGKDGAVVTASTAAFSDALQSHLMDLVKMLPTSSRNPPPDQAPPAPAPGVASAPVIIPQQIPSSPVPSSSVSP